MGGGDALMSLLGLVIISFGFRVYTQRETMKRHFPEIVGATILSSIFSLFSTAFAAKAIGLSAGGCGRAGLVLQDRCENTNSCTRQQVGHVNRGPEMTTKGQCG
jgi:hypothetical protein